MSQEQRQSFRIRVPEELEQAVLKVGGRKIQVRLMDESAGGFAVVLAHTISTSPGQILKLRTSAGWHEVRVIHTVPCDEGSILGLVRLKDLADPRVDHARIATWRDYLFLPKFSAQPRGDGASLGTFATLGICAILLIFVVNSLAHYAPPAANAKIIPGAEDIVSAVTEQMRKTQRSVSQLTNSSSSKMEMPASLATLLSPEIARKLGLSAEQLRELGSSSGSPATSRGDADSRFLEILTPAQASQWKAMQPGS